MTDNTPFVSVVVPVYNAEETIGRCVESILRQTYSDIEVVLVDDGSTDHSGRLCDEWQLCDRRVRVVHQYNKGRTEARAVGTQKARGRWLCYVDADDELTEDSVSSLLDLATEDTDIVFGNAGSLPDEHRSQIPMSDFRRLAIRGEGTIGVPWGSLYRRSVLSDYLFDLPREVMMGEDYLFWIRLSFTTSRPVNALYKNVYRKGDDHTSNCFVWTADYCYLLNELRKASVPAALHNDYAVEMLADRQTNLFALAVSQPRRQWCRHPFYLELMSDLQSYGLSLPLKRRLFLHLPSRWLRRLYSRVSNRICRLR